MKKTLLVLIAGASILAACNSGSNTVATTDKQEAAATSGTQLAVDTTASSLNWFAEKQTGKHNGTFGISDGLVSVTDGQLSGGSFTINVANLAVNDLQGEDKAKLEGHLKSPDFFQVDKYPQAKFEITKVEPAAANTNAAAGATNIISGNLTLKDSTKNVSFPARVSVTDSALSAQADFTIDRTEWGLNYKGPNNPADWLIKKDVTLKLNLVAGRK